MAAAPPNEFSNHLEKWIYSKCACSVVSVEFRPQSANLMQRWQQLDPVPAGTFAYDRREQDSQLRSYATGSVVGQDDEGNLYILTCAHSLTQAFNAQNPVTPEQIAELFRVWIICDHREQSFRRGEDDIRVPIRANFFEVNCINDLLLLQVPSEDLLEYCDRPHNPVSFGRTFPTPLTRVVMLSWPWLRNRTAVRGHISHISRDFNELNEENTYGFDMKLAEVDITSAYGSSGAPLLDAHGEGVGLLYGGDGRFSYFIPLHVIRQNLHQWGWPNYAN